MIACLIVAGCAATPADDSASRDQDRQSSSGFYTGMTGGLIDQMGH